jgi:tetratricopeptide (TPR) repeat protein
LAGVFLSYDHDDKDRARPIALALGRAGHEVWWDLHVRGGAQFSKVIEEALKAADAVVVLWSARSVESAWVRDEASAGRDSGRLIPLSLDRTEPPMGFRQFQTIDFSRGSRGKSAQLGLLLSSIDDLSPARPATTQHPAEPRPSARSGIEPRTLGAVAVGVAALAGAAGLWWFTQRSSSIPTVTVAAAEPSPRSTELARDLFVNLGQVQAAHSDAFEIIEAGDRKRTDFTFKVSNSSSGNYATASVALTDRNRALLWSKNFEGGQGAYGDLKQQVAVVASKVLDCATQAVPDEGTKLNQKTLKLYLNGCADLAGSTEFRRLVPVFREVVRRAPRFEGGWAKLVITEALVIGYEALPRTGPEAAILRKDIAGARKLNARMAEAYAAEYILLPLNDFAGAAALFDRVPRDGPDSLVILGIQGDFLSRVGRIKDVVGAAKRAVELDPISPDTRADFVNALTYAGQPDAALKELKEAEKTWPAADVLTEARFRHFLRFGDPKEALRIMSPDDVGYQSFILARIDPTELKMDRAIADAKARIGQSPRGLDRYAATLAQFSRTDEFYRTMDQLHGPSDKISTEMLFWPVFRSVRQDVRFMRLAKKTGLLNYWRTSGQWPDFCFESDLAYDCKEESAKLSATAT